ncbi:MAG: hypothetical protein ABSH06_18765 [Thermodesulfobacteriota bacterium]
MIQIKVDGHLLIPFGGPKWDIDKIKITGVSTNATYFSSETPCVHINKTEKRAVRLRHLFEVFPDDFSTIENNDSEIALKNIQQYLKKNCGVQTLSEGGFLDIYFDYCLSKVRPTEWHYKRYGKDKIPKPFNDLDWVFDALMPLPQAHLYLSDPLEKGYSFVPKNMVKVDFGFWTGTEILAVEIDGGSHIGSEAHIRKDRLLQRAEVKVIHILNKELLEHGKDVITALLPKEVNKFWEFSEDDYPANPLWKVPF